MASAILTTLQDITASDPAFDSVADATLETFIALAVGQMSATQWGALYTQGAAFLAAHLYAALPGAAATGGASAGGAVTQRKARNWAVQFKQQSAASIADEDLMRTGYGLVFLRLRNQTRSPSLVTP